MNINFDLIRKQGINSEITFEILEILYKQVNDNVFPNIVFNELVEDVSQDTENSNTFILTLSKKPTTISDILLTSEDGSVVITPKFITEIEDRKVTITTNRVKNGMKFYATYKF